MSTMATAVRPPSVNSIRLVCRWCPSRATGLVERWEQEPIGVCNAHWAAMERVGYVVLEVE
jgi:hypothetical protein